MAHIKFIPSQIGSQKLSSYTYTSSPSTLLLHDLLLAFRSLLFLPFIIYPLSPHRSGALCELYPSLANLWDMFLHLVLICLQLPFLLSMPLWVVFPVPLSWILAGVAVFWAVNAAVCRLLNGWRGEMRFRSREEYAGRRKEHEHEQWIFLNGVAVG
jgi:hypothetical protein